MPILNVEIKARCENPEFIRSVLKKNNAEFKGIDYQVDTYFRVPDGRLKLRQGTIEQNLIYYRRPNTRTPKASDIQLVPAEHPQKMRALLEKALEIKVVVEKKREIYFIGNVKFHIDEVEPLGSFVEIEAIDEHGTIGKDTLHKQCRKYLELFEIGEKQLVAESYSDMLLEE